MFLIFDWQNLVTFFQAFCHFKGMDMFIKCPSQEVIKSSSRWGFGYLGRSKSSCFTSIILCFLVFETFETFGTRVLVDLGGFWDERGGVNGSQNESILRVFCCFWVDGSIKWSWDEPQWSVVWMSDLVSCFRYTGGSFPYLLVFWRSLDWFFQEILTWLMRQRVLQCDFGRIVHKLYGFTIYVQCLVILDVLIRTFSIHELRLCFILAILSKQT